MRQILFRAKHEDTGKWIYGDLIHEPFGVCIQYLENGRRIKSKIDEITICQYTGLADKNGNRIWENDIVRTKFFGKDDGKGHNFLNYDEFVVKWHDGAFVLENDKRRFYFHAENKAFEVIGNVFEEDFYGKRAEKD